ncbi:hypothetical protein N826_32945 [Skermanella aerolata KACC 11604]|nr:hypothetical protein N826_32945 [Skermanella aerolata KACC 11604]
MVDSALEFRLTMTSTIWHGIEHPSCEETAFVTMSFANS